MVKFKALALIGLMSVSCAFAQGDTLQMGGTDNVSRFESTGKPTRGMTQDQVRASFGSPENEVAPVGEPPISRWSYAGFVVFFEYDRVIHAVTRR